MTLITSGGGGLNAGGGERGRRGMSPESELQREPISLTASMYSHAPSYRVVGAVLVWIFAPATARPPSGVAASAACSVSTPPHWVLSSTACHAPTSHESQLLWSHVKRSTLVTKPEASGGLACSETTRAST